MMGAVPVRPALQVLLRRPEQQVNGGAASGLPDANWRRIILDDPHPVPREPMLLQRAAVPELQA